MSRGLTQSFTSGARWLGLLTMGRYVVSFGSQIVLARLLMPEHFGDFALMLALVTMGAAMATAQAKTYVVKKKGLTQRQIDAAFGVELFVGGGFFLAFTLGAPAILGAFGREELVLPFQAMSTTLLFTALGFPGGLLQRDMKFRGFYLPQLAGVGGGATIALIGASLGYGLWALIAGKIANHIFETIFLWRAVPQKPIPRFDKETTKELLGFAAPLAGAALMVQVYWHIDQILVERLFDPIALGFYFMGLQLAKHALHLRTGLNQLSYPIFARQDIAAQRISFRRLSWLNAVLYFYLAAFVVGYGPLFVEVLFGSKWMPSVLPLQILMVATAWRGLVCYYEPICVLNEGRHVLFRATALVTVVLPIAVLIGASLFGIAGAALGVTIAAIASSSVLILWARRTLGMDLRGLVNGPVIATGITATVGVFLAPQLQSNLLGFVAALTAATLSYFCSLALADRRRMSGLWRERKNWIEAKETPADVTNELAHS